MPDINLLAMAAVDPFMATNHLVIVIDFDPLGVDLGKDHFSGKMVGYRIAVCSKTDGSILIYFKVFTAKTFHTARIGIQAFTLKL